MPMRERKKIRLVNYDYSALGAYFITACVQHRRCVFGEIRDGQMNLDVCGNIVCNQWEWLHHQYDYLVMDAFVVMPNHFHAILVIAGETAAVGNGHDRSLPPSYRDRLGNDHDHLGNGHDHSLPLPLRKIKTVSELVGAFKTTSSKLIHQSGLADFRWQKSYYDHIIRNEREMYNIRQYIETNPARWAMDIENRDNTIVGNGRDRSPQYDCSPQKKSVTLDEVDRYYRSIPGGK